MLTLFGVAAFLAYWREICAGLAGIIALVVFLVILSKRRAKKRAAAMAARAAKYRYVGNKSTMTFHRLDCHVLRGVPSAQRVGFSSCTEAEACGYKACGACKPWH